MKISFCGTSHIDPEGQERIYQFLLDCKPNIILLEVSGYAVFFRKYPGKLYRQTFLNRLTQMKVPYTVEIKNNLRYFDLPAEYLAVQDYIKRTGTRIHLVDLSLLSFYRLLSAHKILHKNNIRILSTLKEDRFNSERSIAREIFLNHDPHLRELKLTGFEKDPLVKFREYVLIRRVKKYVTRYKDRHIAYIGGWEHLIDDAGGRTLYSNINVPKKRKIIFI